MYKMTRAGMALASSAFSFSSNPAYWKASDTMEHREHQAQRNEDVTFLNERRRIALAEIDEATFSYVTGLSLLPLTI